MSDAGKWGSSSLQQSGFLLSYGLQRLLVHDLQVSDVSVVLRWSCHFESENGEQLTSRASFTRLAEVMPPFDVKHHPDLLLSERNPKMEKKLPKSSALTLVPYKSHYHYTILPATGHACIPVNEGYVRMNSHFVLCVVVIFDYEENGNDPVVFWNSTGNNRATCKMLEGESCPLPL